MAVEQALPSSLLTIFLVLRFGRTLLLEDVAANESRARVGDVLLVLVLVDVHHDLFRPAVVCAEARSELGFFLGVWFFFELTDAVRCTD